MRRTEFVLKLWLPVVCYTSASMQECDLHSLGVTHSGGLAHECVHATATFITILHEGNASWLCRIHMSLCLQCTSQQCAGAMLAAEAPILP